VETSNASAPRRRRLSARIARALLGPRTAEDRADGEPEIDDTGDDDEIDEYELVAGSDFDD
jgi:hypothetical protein